MDILALNKSIMKKFVFLLLILLIVGLFNLTSAQISKGGEPYSFKTVKILSEIPFVVMPFVDVEALKAEDVFTDTIKNIPWRFGQNIDVFLNPKNSGVWDTINENTRIWRLGITSPDALSINLLFDPFKLANGTELFIYSADKKQIIGAFTDFNNRDDGLFATTLLPGDSMIIEYFEPINDAVKSEINLKRVTHGYRGVFDFQKGFGHSGWCNVNVACPESAGMESQIRSVGMLVTGGNGFCTGALINNTSNDGTPYFLSADHCYSNPGSVVYWFNWQSATCANPTSSPPYQSISGATQKARNSTSDFWLVQLSSIPPTSFNVFYSGWNRTTVSSLNEKVWCIHHPSGDIKKISWANNGVTSADWDSYSETRATHWKVGSWSDETTTEPGSSGSPLYDANGRIIGQLHGGSAACGNTYSDYYGKLGVSWTGGGSNSTRLSNWLDPNGSGVMVLEGYPSYPLNIVLNSLNTTGTYTALTSVTMDPGFSTGTSTFIAQIYSPTKTGSFLKILFQSKTIFETQIETDNSAVYPDLWNGYDLSGNKAEPGEYQYIITKDDVQIGSGEVIIK